MDTHTAPGSGTLTVTVRRATGSGRPSNTVFYTLTNPSNVGTGLQTFTAPGGARLNRNTRYFVHMTFSGSGTRPRWNLTTDDREDSGKAIGWSIGNHRYTRPSGATGSWQGGGGTYSGSIEIRVRGTTLAPAAPENLSAAPGEPGETEVMLTWDDPANNTITRYQVRSKVANSADSTYTVWVNIAVTDPEAPPTEYTVTDLTSSTAYTFAVRATNVGGNGAAATVTAATLPAAPTSLLPMPGNEAVTLSWSNSGGDTITKYQVRSKVKDRDDSTYTDWTDIIVTDPDEPPTGYTVTGLTNGREYTFELRAVNDSGNGQAATATATPRAPPGAPEDLLATAGDGQVTLSWTNPGDNTIRRYEVSWKDSSENDSAYNTWAEIAGSSYTTTAHTVTGLTNGTLYDFKLRAVNGIGEGPGSEPKSARTLWPAPTGLVAERGNEQVELEWDANNAITHYRIHTQSGTMLQSLDRLLSGTGDQTTTTITGLTNGTEYTFTVQAVNTAVSPAVISGLPSSATATPAEVPDQPTGLSAERKEDSNGGEVALSWDDPRDGTITKYRVSTDGGTNYTDIPNSGQGQTNATGYTVTGLTNGTLYTFALRAVNNVGESQPSDSQTATPLWPAPQGLVAAPDNKQVVLQWNRGDDGIAKYHVLTEGSGAVVKRELVEVEAEEVAKMTHSVRGGLTNGTEYTFTVRAALGTNAANPTITGVASTVTDTPSDDNKPDAVNNMTAVPGDTQVTLSWDSLDDITIIQYSLTTEYGNESGTEPIFPSAIAPQAGGRDSFVKKDLTNDTVYTFTLFARNASGAGDPDTASATPIAVPVAPENFVAERGSNEGEVALSWDDPSNNTITKYQVSTDGGTNYTDIPNSGQGQTNATGYTVTGLTNGREYTFELRAVNSAGESPSSDSKNATPLWPAPTNLTATADDGRVHLEWDRNPSIARYQIDLELPDSSIQSFYNRPGSGSKVRETIGSSTSLTNDTEYTFTVLAVDENLAVISLPASKQATPKEPDPPAAPTGLSATPGDRQVTLSWNDPEDATITGYQVCWEADDGNDCPDADWADIDGSDKNTTAHTVTGLNNGILYDFKLRAVNDSGEGNEAAAYATPIAVPNAPTNLSANPGDGEVALSWDDLNNETITGYEVCWKEYDGNDCPDPDTEWAEIADSDEDTIAHTVTGLNNGTEYTFALRAVNVSGVGAAATVDATPVAIPGAPVNFVAERGSNEGQVALTWDAPNDSSITRYQYNTDGGTNYTDITNSAHDGTNATGYTVTGLNNGTEYTFALRAVNDSGESAASSDNAKPLWPAPTGLMAAPGDGQVKLNWDKGDGIARYRASTTYTGTRRAYLNTVLSPGSRETTTLVIPGLTNRTDFTFTVQAVDASGSTDTSLPSEEVTATPVPVPAAPILILPATVGNEQVVLTWVNPNDSSITEYQVRWKKKANSAYPDWAEIADSDKDTTAHTVTGLTNDTTYTLAVRAVNDSGEGEASSVVEATPTDIPNAPDAPDGLSATAGNGQVALTWEDLNDSTITKYHYSTDGGATFTDITDSSATTTTYTVTGLSDGTSTPLTNGTQYTLAVRAYNDQNGLASTVDATPIAPPAEPVISSVGEGYRKVALEWDDPNDSTITGYQVCSKENDGNACTDNQWAAIDESRANTTAHTVTGLTNGTEYTFELRAVNDAGEGDEAAMNATPVNSHPTSSGGSVSTNENESYRFTINDFNYQDAEVTMLQGVKIASLPKDSQGNDGDRGTLSLDGMAIASVPQEVMSTDLNAGALTYTPPENGYGDPFASFGYAVSDGESFSAENTMEIQVNPVFLVRFDAAAYEGEEGGNPVTVKVTLNKSVTDADLKIPITVTPQGRTVPADYKVDGLVDDPDPNVTGSLRFDGSEDNNTRTFTIKADEDDDFRDVTVALGFGTLPDDAAAGKPATATLTLIDAEGAVVRARFRRLNNEILSKHALTLADVTIAAVTSRQEAGPRCADQANTGSLGGQSSLAEILRANAQTLTTGSLNLKQLLGTSAFRLRLTEDGATGPGCLTLWGQGDYRNLSSSDAQALEWDGDLVTGQVGADALLRPDLRAGLAVSWSDGAFNYTDRTTGDPFSGDYSSRMVSVHPYVTWWAPMGLDVWATGGYGRGEIEINDEQAGTHTSDTTLRLASVGASGPLLSEAGLLPGGTTTLRLKAQASVAQMDVEGNGPFLEEQTIEAQRLRLALEGSHERLLASGGSLTPSLEVGLRHDGGDGATGTGLELGGGLRYVNPALGLTVEGRGRVLAAYEEDYEEWGASGLIRLDPGLDRQGLSFSLVPSYGQTASGVQRLWDQGLPQGAPTTQAPTGRLEAEVGYGLVAFAGQGLVTPYSAVILGGGTQQYPRGQSTGARPGVAPEPGRDPPSDHCGPGRSWDPAASGLAVLVGVRSSFSFSPSP